MKTRTPQQHNTTITFALGEPARTFTPRQDPGNPWRFIGDEFAAVLSPVCYAQAQAVQHGDKPPLFDGLKVWPVQWGIPDSILTDHAAEVEELRRELYDPKPEAQKAALPLAAWLEQTAKRELWKKHCKHLAPELVRQWLTPVGGAGFELFLHARKERPGFDHPWQTRVCLYDLERISHRADFRHRNSVTTIYLDACLQARLTPDEERISPAFQAQEEARRLAIAQDREAGERYAAHARNILAGTAEIAEKLQPLTDFYQDESMAAVRQAAGKQGVPKLFIDWTLSKFHGSKFPTSRQAVKEICGKPLGNDLAAGGNGTSRPTFDRWLTDIRRELEKRGHLQPRSKGPAATRAKSYNLDNHPAPPISDAGTPQTLSRELGESPDD